VSSLQHGSRGSYHIKTATYYSEPITLKAGHMIFTNPQKTPLKMPTGKYAITHFFGDIVYNDTLTSVPLEEVYTHHWIARSSNHENKLCPKGPQYVFGIGAESRNNPVDFPPGFGYVVIDGTTWGANIHLLRTVGLSGDQHKAAKECNECYYGPEKHCTPAQNGSFACCGERDTLGVSKCSTVSNPPPPKTYRLRYTFSYTTEMSAIEPLMVGVLAAPNCREYYDVLRNDTYPSLDVVSLEFVAPMPAKVLFAVGHMHTGGNYITLSLNGKHVCTSTCHYGTEEGVPGNEKGYLVQMSQCINASTGPLVVKKNDKLRLDAIYNVASNDDRVLYSDGTHLNVMSYMYVGYSTINEELALS